VLIYPSVGAGQSISKNGCTAFEVAHPEFNTTIDDGGATAA
jgi:hypothetical protein